MTRTTIVLFSMATAGLVHAQLEIRPLVGINYRNLTEPPQGSEWKTGSGYQFGGDLMFAGRVHFMAGLQYVHSNTALVTHVAGKGPVQSSFTTGSLRAPIRFGYRFIDPSESPAINPRFFGGAAVAVPLLGEFDDEGIDEVGLGDAQVSLTFGAGLDIKFLYIEAGYDVGLVPMFDDERITTDPKANMLQINAGIRLKLAN
jgi:hypothetical protein